MINIFLLWFSIYFGYCFGSDFKYCLILLLTSLQKYAGKTVYEFLGVPYAKEPIGKRRFTPPLPFEKEDWDDEPYYNATYVRNGCYQNTRDFPLPGFNWTHPSSIAEHCLHVNIWKSASPNGGVLVVFFDVLHMRGSGTLDELNGGYLAAKTDLIVITVSYRLSIFGFGYLGEDGKYLTGNTGLLDQQMSLQWVYENIDKFGGDGKKITIAGFGSASTLATAHLFSTKSHKYFSSIFASSESITSMWSYNSREVAEKATRDVAYRVGCTNKTDYDIYKCLLKANPYKLAVAAEDLMFRGNFPFQYGFNVINYDNVFFNGNLITKIKNRKMKEDFIFFGSKSKYIGALYLAMFSDKYDFGFKTEGIFTNISYSSFKISYSQFKIFMSKINKHLGLKDYELKLIYEKYVDVKKIKKIKDFKSIIVKIVSDIYFNVGMEKFVYDLSYEHLSKKTYFYEFVRTSSGDRSRFPEWVLPRPGSEMEYFFGNPFTMSYKYNKKFIKLDQRVSYKMMMMMKSFVTTGKPGSKWYGFSTSSKNVFIVGDNNYCKDKSKKVSKTSVYTDKIKSLIQILPKEFNLQI
uniref:COesterase domain-containing protein n=1 Tax=Strongyloides papillosus TaxID=174720 RepID=A0A0N5BPW2_STREA